jgi:hypothetical protein
MDNNKKQMGNQPNDHWSVDGIITIPQSLGHQSRLYHLGDTASGLPVDDLEISRTTKGTHMRMPRTKEQIAGTIAYAIGYVLTLATLAKFAWWVWQQPW